MHVDSIFESVNKAHASSSTWSATLIKTEQKGDVVVHWYSAPDFWGRRGPLPGSNPATPTMILMGCRIIV